MTVTIENTAVDTTLNIAELTTGSLTGTGVFDVLLQTLRLHLDREFTSGRITGTAYATVYSQALTSFLQQATAYCLSKAKLALELKQMQEVIELTQLQQTKLIADTRQTDYITDSQLPAETALKAKELDVRAYELTNIKPQELALVTQQVATQQYTVATRMPAEVAGIQAETSLKAYELSNVQPAQVAQVTAQTAQVTYTTANLIPAQVASTTAQTSQVTYTVANLLPSQLAQTTAQTALLTYDLGTVKPAEVTNLTKQGTLLDSQKTVADKQALSTEAETAQTVYKTTYSLPEEVKVVGFTQDRILAEVNKISNDTVASIKQGRLIDAQTANTTAQTELYAQKKVTELAQTTTTPAANSVMGVQNALMVKQTENYERDAEQKAAKIMIDTWNVRRNADTAQAPTNLANRLREEDIGIAVAALLSGLTP